MTFEQYWGVVVKRWRLIVMSTLLVSVGATIGSRFIIPLYQSSALVQVIVDSGNNPSAYTSLLASDQLVQTEALLATTDSVLREVASHYRGLTVNQIAGEVTSSPKLNTQLFEIDVLDPNPRRAAALANDIAQTLVKQQLEATQQSNLQLVQMAQPGAEPVQPNTRLNTLFGLVVGLLLGMLLTAVLELLDKRVVTPEMLSQLVGWPVLTTIWQISIDKKRQKGALSLEEIVHTSESDDSNAESYRMLRTNIGFSAIDKPLHTLMITSALSGEGKSMVAANLARFMARAGKTTLLVDANLRHPILHTIFGFAPDKQGFSNAILALSKLPEDNTSVRHQPLSLLSDGEQTTPPVSLPIVLEPFLYAVDIPYLWVMPAGSLPPNPAELLDSKAMRHFLELLARYNFDVIIFDAPSLLGISDARILAAKADGAVLVVDITRSDKRNLVRAKALLETVGTSILGCVINKQPRTRRNNDPSVSFTLNHTDEQGGTNHHRPKDINSPTVLVQAVRWHKGQSGQGHVE